MTADLTDFLLARIAEDEASAKDFEFQALSRDGWLPEQIGPARVLAQCAALREVVERYVTAAAEAEAAWKDYSEWFASSDKAWRGEHPPPRTVPAEELNGLAWAVTALAAIWRDHPDYRPEEWA